MKFKPINRDWVKNAAIIFLAVLLVLTFFSNTIMNRSLPEVATQQVVDGSITAKVRGTGTVTAAGVHTVKAEQTREIRSVMIKAGQEINAGDVLFVLGEGSSEEIEAAQEKLRTLQISYQRSALGGPVMDYSADERRIDRAYDNMKELEAKYQAEQKKLNDGVMGNQLAELNHQMDELQASVENDQKELETTQGKLTAAQEDLAAAQQRLAEANEALQYAQGAKDAAVSAAQQAYDDAKSEKTHLDEIYEQGMQILRETTDEEGNPISETIEVVFGGETKEQLEAKIADAEAKEAAAKADYESKQNIDTSAEEQAVKSEQEAVNAAQARVDEVQAEIDEINADIAALQAKMEKQQTAIDEMVATIGANEAYEQAKAAYNDAYDTYLNLVDALNQKKAADSRSAALTGVDLTDIAQQIEIAKEKLNELTGGEENQIKSKVSGVVQTVDCTSGDKKAKDEVLCTIEVPDLGYNLSFTVTNDQARRLKPGDSATVSNYYWGSEILATLSSITVDPKNPTTNKLLTFDVTGDVNVGSELTLSVGQKSANYDVVVPNSAIRSDANGSFVLAVEARNSPLGNRYIARRVNVEVLAADDLNSAVTGDLGYGDYVITTSNAPVKTGDMVRLADNT